MSKKNGKLPNSIDIKALPDLLKYSNKYEITIQFWPDQVAIYIAKDGIDLSSHGGDFDFAIKRAIEYLNRITKNNIDKKLIIPSYPKGVI